MLQKSERTNLLIGPCKMFPKKNNHVFERMPPLRVEKAIYIIQW